ncbi:MAG TPA: patatin-like phospholipase family protein [Candidatus Cloacimonadota bacterium]|nr:patatin-like phospholipase family protein [Candidatus Cloacimonadota bacterium]
MAAKMKARLILGGGSAYGLAHIGVIKAVQEHYEISGIVGTSMGAILGACAACSMTPEEMLNTAEDIRTLELFNPLNLDFSHSGIFDGQASYKRFKKWTQSRFIETGDIPFVAVAFDLNSQRSVLLDKGLYADAMRASSSLPYIYAPYSLGKYLFVDGGVAHPLPLAFKDIVPGDLTIAVNVLPAVPMQAERLVKSRAVKQARILSHQVFMQSVMYNQGFIALQSMLQYKPDIYIDAHKADLKFTDLGKAREFYFYGYEKAQQSIKAHREPGFREFLEEKYRKLLEKIDFLDLLK